MSINIFPTEVQWNDKNSAKLHGDSFTVPGNSKRIWDHVIRHRRAVSSKCETTFYNNRKNNRETSKELSGTASPRDLIKYEAPQSVISESVQKKLGRKFYPEEELYSFGEVYENNILELIHRFLEIDTQHKVAYVGPSKGSLANKIRNFFCLEQNVESIYPGVIHCQDIRNRTKRLAFSISNIAAEEYFKQCASEIEETERYDNGYDRIIFVESIQYFNNLKETFANVMKAIKSNGKIMIIHRPICYSTLPLYKSARKRLQETEIGYMDVINALQKTGADVQWELEHIPILMEKEKWLAMLRNRFPTQLDIMSNYETDHGIRELVDGSFKYLGTHMELEDRLMFITASHNFFDCAYPTVQRIGASAMQPFTATTAQDFKMNITENIEYLLKEIQNDEKDKKRVTSTKLF